MAPLGSAGIAAMTALAMRVCGVGLVGSRRGLAQRVHGKARPTYIMTYINIRIVAFEEGARNLPCFYLALQGVRVDPLVKSARSSIWHMDRSGSILKGKGSKGSRTYRSVVPQGSDLLGRGAITAQRRRRSR